MRNTLQPSICNFGDFTIIHPTPPQDRNETHFVMLLSKFVLGQAVVNTIDTIVVTG